MAKLHCEHTDLLNSLVFGPSRTPSDKGPYRVCNGRMWFSKSLNHFLRLSLEGGQKTLTAFVRILKLQSFTVEW